jgi:hypothetical protein
LIELTATTLRGWTIDGRRRTGWREVLVGFVAHDAVSSLYRLSEGLTKGNPVVNLIFVAAVLLIHLNP